MCGKTGVTGLCRVCAGFHLAVTPQFVLNQHKTVSTRIGCAMSAMARAKTLC